MVDQVHASLKSLGDRKPVRTGVADITFAASGTQERLMRHMAIVAVDFFSNEKKDFETSTLTVVSKSPGIPNTILPAIFPYAPIKALDPKSDVANLGQYHQLSFFFMPYDLLSKPGELILKVSKKPVSLPLLRLPIGIPHAAEPTETLTPGELREPPDPETALSLIRNQYCLPF